MNHRKPCELCEDYFYFTPSDDEPDLCPICQADDDLQREMDRDVE